MCRELVKVTDSAVDHLNLGECLCVRGDIEQGMSHYKIA